MSETGGEADTAITIPLFVEELHWYPMKAFAIRILGVVTWIRRVEKTESSPNNQGKLLTEMHK